MPLSLAPGGRPPSGRPPRRAAGRAAAASTPPAAGTPAPLPVVILPGLGNASDDYAGLAAGLAARGAPAVVTAPVARIDWLRNAAGLVRPEYWTGKLTPRPTVDWYLDAIEKAVADARASAGLDGKVALVAHSAGGWLARTWLLGGGVGAAASLTTLGSPHSPPPPDAGLPDQTRGILTWVRDNAPGAFHDQVRYTTVAARYLKGAPLLGGGGEKLAARLAGAGYASLCGRPDVWGDAITPVETAHLDGATQITLDGVFHGPLGATPDPEKGMEVPPGQRFWYGSAPVIDQWAVSALGVTPLGRVHLAPSPRRPRMRCVAQAAATVGDQLAPTFTLPPDYCPPLSFRRLLGTRVPAPDFRSAASVVDVPWIDPGPGEVAVKIAYAGVNGGCETFRVRAEPGTPFAAGSSADAPVLLGAEGVGIVAAVGPSVSSLSVGDAVSVSGGSAFSEFVVAPSARCTRLPGAPTPEACALTLSGVTAAVALETCGVAKGVVPLSEADSVLVTAAAGGTGHLAAQLAALSGARVFATAGGPAKAAALGRLLSPWAGRVRVIDHTAEDVAAVLADECPAPGLAAAYEGVGGGLRAAAAAALAPGGRLLAVGHIAEYPNAASDRRAGAPPPPSPSSLPPAHDTFWGGREVDLGAGRTLYGNVWAAADPRTVARLRRKVFSLHADGRIRVLIDHPIPVGLGAAAGAVERLMGGASTGKVVLQVWE